MIDISRCRGKYTSREMYLDDTMIWFVWLQRPDEAQISLLMSLSAMYAI